MKKIIVGFGAAVSLAAVFARPLGIDNDADWGRGRLFLLTSGLIFVATGTILHFFGAKISLFLFKINTTIEKTTSRSARLLLAVLFASMTVLVSYFWFIHLNGRVAGAGFEYYVELAKSFKMGQLSLEVDPPPELLAMENPYDYFLRRKLGVENFPWDVSLYKNKFYIYWGPVPAILLTILSPNILGKTGDFHLALVFACGIFIYFTLLVSVFWRDSLPHAPAWLLAMLIVVFGLITPTTMMLKSAKIYEAAIFGSQFFFMGGIYWGYRALSKEKISMWMLTLASLHWALAAGSRIIVLPAAFFCATLTVFHLYKNFGFRNIPSLFPRATVIFLPLAAGALAQAWYNWARFDSIFEFGLEYQLANIDYTKFGPLFSMRHVLNNIYIYFLLPLKLLPKFPYLARVEYINSNERMAGLTYIAPFIFLSIFPLVQSLKSFLPEKVSSPTEISKKLSENWLIQASLGSGILLLTIILSYYFIALRFVEDFMPTLILASVIQIGRTYDSLHEKATIRKGFIASVLFLSGITVTANVLLALPSSGISFMLNLLNSISKILGLR